MKSEASKLRQALRRIEGVRQEYLEGVLDIRRPLRKGSLVTVRRKCGKPTCHCVTGEGHQATYLSVKEGGKTRMLYVPAPLEDKVTQEAVRYRQLRHARAQLAKLCRQTLELIDKLEQVLTTTEELASSQTMKTDRKLTTSAKKRSGKS